MAAVRKHTQALSLFPKAGRRAGSGCLHVHRLQPVCLTQLEGTVISLAKEESLVMAQVGLTKMSCNQTR